MAEDFDFKSVEEKIKKFWENEGIYKFNPKSKKKIYSIDTPPPTLSGRMHIGHAFSYSQTDFMARFMRMSGNEVFYPFGTDDNGLPTERLVEREKNIKSKEMPRAEFVEMCMNFLGEERSKFIQDWKDIGISCDWNLSYSTINEQSRKIAQWSFLDLYKKGRIYRKDAPSMWCPECKTGVAQVEVKDKELSSSFNDIVFRVDAKLGKDLIISTTRPELLPACVAVFYHPEDSRFKRYKGKRARVPLFGFDIPIFEDKRVDMNKGTGIVMCCTFGDQTDMEWQKAYNLPIKMAINENGCMTDLAGKYKGMPIREARKAIIQDLRKLGLLINEREIKHFVNVHERCGVEIEFIKKKQWFVRYLDLKKGMLEWGMKLKWHPEFMRSRYENWVNGLQWDWLISNQRHFGAPFPVWYCQSCGEVILAPEKALPVDPMKDKPPVSSCVRCKSKLFIPESDVFNTWFTSSMTPQIAVNLVKDDKIREKLFPMSLRPQAHDIITFWLFNTLLKSRLHFNKNPWKDVAISGFVTLEGEKMSKSKGNVIEPREIMDKYGADALRYWAASSKLGEDFNYQEKDVLTGKRFVTKLLNATKFVFLNLKDYDGKKPKELERIDELFLEVLNHKMEIVIRNFKNYNYSLAKSVAEELFWNYFCDNYLEIVKWRVYNGSKKEKASAFYTLYNSLLTILKLMAPFTPFITEEIYQNYFKKYEKEKSIHVSDWPEFKTKGKVKPGDFLFFVELLSSVRKRKSENKIAMNAEIILTLPKKYKKELEAKELMKDFKNVTKAVEVVGGNSLIVEEN